MVLRKKPHFFCEKCGAKVGQNEKACPQCGRLFASVKCPACGYSGQSEEFSHGCPRCKYAFDSDGTSKTKKSRSQSNKKSTVSHDPLPLWIYIVVVLLLVVVLCLLK